MSREFKINEKLLKEVVYYKGRPYFLGVDEGIIASISTKQGWKVFISNSKLIKFVDSNNKDITFEGNEGVAHLRKLYEEKGLEYVEKYINFEYGYGQEHFDIFLEINGDIVDSTTTYLNGSGKEEIFSNLGEKLDNWLKTRVFKEVDGRFKTLLHLVRECSIGESYYPEEYDEAVDNIYSIILSLDNDLNKEK